MTYLCQKLHFPLAIHATLNSNPIPQSALGKQIREPRRQSYGCNVNSVGPILKDKPEHGTVWVFAVIGIK